MRLMIEIKCTKNSRVPEERLFGYIIKAIAGVVANNGGIITCLKCETDEEESGV